MPPRVAGGSGTSKKAKRATRRCIKNASHAMSPPKITILSSPATHLNPFVLAEGTYERHLPEHSRLPSRALPQGVDPRRHREGRRCSFLSRRGKGAPDCPR